MSDINKDDQENENIVKNQNVSADAKKTEQKIKNPSIPFFKLLYHFLTKSDKWVLIFAFIGSFGVGISLPLFALFFGESISELNTATSSADFVKIFYQLLIKFIIVGIAMLFGGILMYFLWTLNGRVIALRLKKEYFKLLLKQEQGFFDKENPYEFFFKLQNQVQTIENGMGMKVGHLIMAITLFISSFVVGYYTSWKLSLVITSVVPFFILGAFLIDVLIRNRGKQSDKKYEKAGGIAEEVIHQIKTVTSFANYTYELDRFNTSVDEASKHSVIHGKRSSILMGVYFFVIFGTLALAVWYCSILISQNDYNTAGKYLLSSGDFLVVIFTVIFGSLALGQAIPNAKAISNACTAAYDYFELIKREPEIDLSNSKEKPNKDAITGRILFKDVSFSYPTKKEKIVLNKFNMVFEPRKKTAIVGESGSGKSTVANLIERFYEADSGEIMIDDFNLKNLDVEYLRSLIGYAPQEPVLFNASIRDNIKFGRDDITDEEVIEACKRAYVDEFVNKIENGLDYVVGFKGSKLSGGQKQRIAIARAIVKKPKILILDESTSALDYVSEREVQKALDQVSQEITTIVIANRLSTIINSDHIYVLSGTAIVEQGKHENLLALNGIYSALIQSQIDQQNIITGMSDSQSKTKSHNDNINEESDKLGMKIIDQHINGNNAEIKILNNNKNQTHNILANNQNENFGLNFDDKNLQKSTSENANKSSIDAKAVRKKVWQLLKETKLLVISAAFFAVCSGAVWSAYGILLATTINALQQVNIILKNGATTAGWFILVAAISGICIALQNYLLVIIGERLTKKLRKQLFEKYLRFNLSFFDRTENSAGSLLTQLSSETQKINGIAISMVGTSIQIVSTIVVSLIVSFIYDWRLALIYIAFFPITAIATVCMYRAQKKLKNSSQEIDKESGSILTETLLNTKTIYAFNMQDKMIERYSVILSSQNKLILKTSILNGISFGIILLLMFFVFGILLYCVATFISQGTSMDNTLRSVFPLLFALFGLTLTSQYVGDMSNANEALAHIFNILEEPSAIDPFDIENKLGHEVQIGKIEFRNVSFCYPGRPNLQVLKNISFTLNPGESLGLIGFSGSGKSTIIQLIERFYDPTSGAILVDDIDLKNYELGSYRKSLSLLMEEPSLFKRSVIENIQYGKLDADRQEVENAAVKANISHFLNLDLLNSNLPVSGGEKQRICLARAIIRNSKILLLDEPSAALDKNSEDVIQKSIDGLKSTRTTIEIAHKLATIENCDKIIMLENGEIVEEGRHENLLASRGKYFSLYNAGKINEKKK